MAFFSGTDNANDKRNIGISGVIGELNKQVWTSKWRFNFFEKNAELSLADIFDFGFVLDPQFRQAALKGGSVVIKGGNLAFETANIMAVDFGLPETPKEWLDNVTKGYYAGAGTSFNFGHGPGRRNFNDGGIDDDYLGEDWFRNFPSGGGVNSGKKHDTAGKVSQFPAGNGTAASDINAANSARRLGHSSVTSIPGGRELDGVFVDVITDFSDTFKDADTQIREGNPHLTTVIQETYAAYHAAGNGKLVVV